MPSGRVHLTMALLADIPLAFLSYVLLREGAYEASLGIMTGAAIGTMVTPDMDQEGTTETERIARKIPIIGPWWQMEWYPYARVSKHRGLSHVIIVGTLMRAAYMSYRIWYFLLFLAGLGVVYFGRFMAVEDAALSLSWIPAAEVSMFMLMAWSLQDAIHIITDKVSSVRPIRAIRVRGRKPLPSRVKSFPFQIDM